MRTLISILAVSIIAAAILTGCTSKDRKVPAGVKVTQNGDGANRISATDLKNAMDQGMVVVVDVRGQGAYDSGHIKGSIMIPGAEIGNKINELPPNKWIITYCS